MSDPAGTRTQDPYIKSVLLYQLSYGIIPIIKTNVLFFGSAKISEKQMLANFYLIIFPREMNGYQLFLSNLAGADQALAQHTSNHKSRAATIAAG